MPGPQAGRASPWRACWGRAWSRASSAWPAAWGWGERLVGADLCLSGEGRLDAQSLDGKAVSGVCRLAAQAGVPVLLFAGVVEQAELIMQRTGAAQAIAISDPRAPLALSLAQGPERLRG